LINITGGRPDPLENLSNNLFTFWIENKNSRAIDRLLDKCQSYFKPQTTRVPSIDNGTDGFTLSKALQQLRGFRQRLPFDLLAGGKTTTTTKKQMDYLEKEPDVDDVIPVNRYICEREAPRGGGSF
jgi:hypothetical protein